MNNKLLKRIIFVLGGLYLTAPQAVYAKSAFTGELKVVIARFSTAMIGVLVFSFLIYLLLAIYNKFFVASHIKDEEIRRDSLNSPRDKDEAIMKFIMKNRLK